LGHAGFVSYAPRAGLADGSNARIIAKMSVSNVVGAGPPLI
jgi:hypothetical protein